MVLSRLGINSDNLASGESDKKYFAESVNISV